MSGRGRHAEGALWSAITILIAAVAMVVPQGAQADVLPVAPSALAQAGLAEAQNAVDTVASAVSAAQPAIAVPIVTSAAPAAAPTAPVRAVATPPAAAPQPAARPAAATAGAASPVPRPPAPPAHPARAADPPVPVAASAARAGAYSGPAVTAPAVPVHMPPLTVVPMPSLPAVTVPAVSVPAVSVPVVGAVPTVPLSAISIPWPDAWASVFTPATVTSPATGSPVLAPGLGVLPSMGWPLSLPGIPGTGAAPLLPGTLGGGVVTPLGHAGLPHQRHRTSSTGHRRARHTESSVRSVSRSRGLVLVSSPSWPAHVGRPALPGRAPVRLSLHPARRGDVPPRPARSAPEPSSSAPPLTVPVTGGGPAAAAAGTGAGAGATALMAAGTLLLIFLLSTRVSLDLSAWRSTLLSLRLERPG